jgi:2-oxoisovalerate dehydrogenase E1 component alpha subunit
MSQDDDAGHGEAGTGWAEACRRYISADGKAVDELPGFAGEREQLRALYRALVLTRVFDEKAVALQRTGRLGTFASSLGQEAVSVGVTSAMRGEDVFVPSFREQGGQLWRGVTPEELLSYWGGDERGSDFAGPREDFPVSIPVASHVPHAVGVALAFQQRSEARVAVAVFGDGATSKGDFYEALNMAGVWQVPAVFVATNNQWAISVPRAKQTATRTLAQKSLAVGIPSEQVDGNDVIAVRAAVHEAVERARQGQGPSFIEALTYRLGDHTTADDAHRYRSDAEVSAHWRDDPVARLRTYMGDAGLWSKADEERLLEDCRTRIDAAARAVTEVSPQEVTDMFDDLFAELPEDVARQRARALAKARGQDDA